MTGSSSCCKTATQGDQPLEESDIHALFQIFGHSRDGAGSESTGDEDDEDVDMWQDQVRFSEELDWYHRAEAEEETEVTTWEFVEPAARKPRATAPVADPSCIVDKVKNALLDRLLADALIERDQSASLCGSTAKPSALPASSALGSTAKAVPMPVPAPAMLAVPEKARPPLPPPKAEAKAVRPLLRSSFLFGEILCHVDPKLCFLLCTYAISGDPRFATCLRALGTEPVSQTRWRKATLKI